MHTMLKLVAALAAAGALSNAQAVVVSPGGGAVAGPTVGSPYPSVSDFGTLLGFVSTDVKTSSFAGEARAAVFDGKEAGVNLDFYYQFTNYSDSTDAISRIAAGGYAGMNVDIRQDGGMWGDFVRGMEAVDTIDLSNNGTLGFNFDPSVLPGRTTTVLRVRTAATSFVDDWMNIIGGTTAVAPAFAPGGAVLPPPIVDIPGEGLPPPVAEVPEPETYAMMLAGLGMLGFVGRRRRHDTKA